MPKFINDNRMQVDVITTTDKTRISRGIHGCHTFTVTPVILKAFYTVGKLTPEHREKIKEYLKDLEDLGIKASLGDDDFLEYDNEHAFKKEKSTHIRIFLMQLTRFSIKNEVFLNKYLQAKRKLPSLTTWERIYVAANRLSNKPNAYYDIFDGNKFDYITFPTVKRLIKKHCFIQGIFTAALNTKFDSSAIVDKPLLKQLKSVRFHSFNIKRGIDIGEGRKTSGQVVIQRSILGPKDEIGLYVYDNRGNSKYITILAEECKKKLIW